jgi:hypothetical protein
VNSSHAQTCPRWRAPWRSRLAPMEPQLEELVQTANLNLVPRSRARKRPLHVHLEAFLRVSCVSIMKRVLAIDGLDQTKAAAICYLHIRVINGVQKAVGSCASNIKYQIWR